MDHHAARQTLHDAAKLRVPRFDKDEMLTSRIGKLEDWSIKAARWRGHLEEARLYMEEVLHSFRLTWDKLDGWEVQLPGGKKRKDATRDDITEAKRLTDPTLWENISDLKHLISQLSLQIRRIEKDEERVSRVYTFLTGN